MSTEQATRNEAGYVSCTECGWKVRHPREYHPFVACIIVTATGCDPLPYLREVATDMARVDEIGVYGADR